MGVEIKKKILKELQNLHNNNSVGYQEQAELFWHYTVHAEKEKGRVRVYKFFIKYENSEPFCA